MPAFRIVQTPQPPGCCVFCGSFDTVLVEPVPEKSLPGLGVELPNFGRLYICARNDEQTGCAVQIAELTGSLSKRASEQAREALEEVRREIARLTRELARKNDPVVLSREEYERLVEDADV